MSELISGQEALEAVMNGYKIQYRFPNGFWMDYTNSPNSRLEEDDFYNDYAYFRLKRGSDNTVQKEEDMNSEGIISGKEALIALANGKEVEYNSIGDWGDAKHLRVYSFLSADYKFRLKPSTITINNIEVPATFEPKEGEVFYYINDYSEDGYDWATYTDTLFSNTVWIGKWRKEEEIQQVIKALQSVFK